MYTLPAGWYIYSQTADSVTVARPGHTVSAPRLVIFDRKVPTLNPQGTFSVPTYRVRFIDGHVDGDGIPLREKSLVELTVRNPLPAGVVAVTASLAAMATLVAAAEFVDDAVNDQMFPREA